LWLDGYKAGIPHRKVSIYHKGALAALILDLEIRRATQNRQSLDAVMVRLWQEFGQTGIGYTEADYTGLVAEVAQTPFTTYFEEVIFGTAPLQPYLEQALHYVGCTLVALPSAILSEEVFGFKTAYREQVLEVTGIAPGSPAAAVLSLDDELIAVNGRRISGNLSGLLPGSHPVELALFRNKRLRQVILTPGEQSYYPKYRVSKLPDAASWQQENFRLWLKQPF
jgi:predicted metalloprotease with PDZ domain